jgi:hypothetical protein
MEPFESYFYLHFGFGRYNNIGYRNLLYPLHVSTVKRREHSSRLRRPLCLCALENNVFTGVINLDRYNMFLLGLTFQGILMLLQDFLLLHQLILLVSHNLLALAQMHFLKRPKKPPDPVASSYDRDATHGLIACSSPINNEVSEWDIFTESFDPEEQRIIGLDSLCSRHLFSDLSDFVSDLTPITPFEIHGVGGNIKAISKGSVRLRFRDSTGTIRDKILSNAYHAPNCPVRLISIPQLARDTYYCIPHFPVWGTLFTGLCWQSPSSSIIQHMLFGSQQFECPECSHFVQLSFPKH